MTEQLSEGTTNEPAWRDLALEEHRALRAEVIASLQGQLQALGLSTAAIAVLAAGGFSVWEDAPFGAAAVFFAGLPALALVGLFVWTGENARILRAGRQLLHIEMTMHALHSGMPKNVFAWEMGLAGGKKQERLATVDVRYLPVSIVYGVIAIGSVLVGWQLAESEEVTFFSVHGDWLAACIAVIVGVSVVLCLLQMWYLEKHHREPVAEA